MPIFEIGKNMTGVCITPVKSRMLPVLFGIMVITMLPVGARGATIVEWDFGKGTHGWTGNSRVENLRSSAEGLIVKSTGQDPWIEGPAVDLPGDKMVRVKIRMKSNADPHAELFYGRAFVAGRSLRFTVRNDGQWHNYSLIIKEKLGPGTRFRLDPCTDKGELAVAFINVETLSDVVSPLLEKPKRPDKTKGIKAALKSGMLAFEHYGTRWGNCVFKVDGVEMAVEYNAGLISVLFEDEIEWLNLGKASHDFQSFGNVGFASRSTIKDSRGGRWQIQKNMKPGKQEGTLAVEVELKVNEDRDVLHMPWLTLFPGLDTFGHSKDQGLLAGVEYLCDEPSSSDADIATPQHHSTSAVFPTQSK
jgi:hypothetical protein